MLLPPIQNKCHCFELRIVTLVQSRGNNIFNINFEINIPKSKKENVLTQLDDFTFSKPPKGGHTRPRGTAALPIPGILSSPMASSSSSRCARYPLPLVHLQASFLSLPERRTLCP